MEKLIEDIPTSARFLFPQYIKLRLIREKYVLPLFKFGQGHESTTALVWALYLGAGVTPEPTKTQQSNTEPLEMVGTGPLP